MRTRRPSRLRRITVSAAVLAVLAASIGAGVTGAASRASHGLEPTLCSGKMDVSRGAVPATFPLEACIEGGGVWIHDDREIPVRLYLTGDTGKPKTVRAANATLAADAMWAVEGLSSTLIAPGQTTFVPIGSGAASVSVVNDTAAVNTYVIAGGLVSLIGAAKLKGTADAVAKNAGNADTAAAYVGELTAVFQKYQACRGLHPSFFTRVKCESALEHDVLFATARAGVTIASTTVALAISAIETWKVTFTINSQLNAINDGQRTISLRAA